MARRGMTYDAPARYASLIAPRYAPIADRLLEAARLRADDDVLELGAGTGLLTKRAAPAVRSYVATDLSAEMLELARASLRRPHVTYALVDYSRPLPFLDASFSLALSALTYVQRTADAVAEVARVLKPNGRFALSMWGPTYHEKQMHNKAIRSIGGARFPDAAPGAAVRRLERAGFRSVRRKDFELTSRFPSVEDYMSYRRGFGIPLAWTRAFYERYLDAVRREAARTAAPDGSFELGWMLTMITAQWPHD